VDLRLLDDLLLPIPGSDIWVSFCDLPKATRDPLWKKPEAAVAFAEPLYVIDVTRHRYGTQKRTILLHVAAQV